MEDLIQLILEEIEEFENLTNRRIYIDKVIDIYYYNSDDVIRLRKIRDYIWFNNNWKIRNTGRGSYQNEINGCWY